MAYNIIDIIDKAIFIAQKRKSIINQVTKDDISVELMSRVILKEIDKRIAYYENLKSEVKGIQVEEIDIYVYDKISFLMDNFNKKIVSAKMTNPRDYLERSVDMEKDLYAMFVDVRGRFVNKSSDVNTKTYEVLTKIINTKADIVEMFEKSLK